MVPADKIFWPELCSSAAVLFRATRFSVFPAGNDGGVSYILEACREREGCSSGQKGFIMLVYGLSLERGCCGRRRGMLSEAKLAFPPEHERRK